MYITHELQHLCISRMQIYLPFPALLCMLCLFIVATKISKDKQMFPLLFYLRAKKGLMEKEENLDSKAYL